MHDGKPKLSLHLVPGDDKSEPLRFTYINPEGISHKNNSHRCTNDQFNIYIY